MQLKHAVDDYMCFLIETLIYAEVFTGRHVRATTRGHYTFSATPQSHTTKPFVFHTCPSSLLPQRVKFSAYFFHTKSKGIHLNTKYFYTKYNGMPTEGCRWGRGEGRKANIRNVILFSFIKQLGQKNSFGLPL